MVLVLFVIGFATAAAWISYRLYFARYLELGNRLPGPKNDFILGNAYLFVNVPGEGILNKIGTLFDKYGNTFRLWLGHELTVASRDTKDLEVIMTGKNFIKKGSFYDVMKPWLNEGVLLSSGKKWHSRRKLITPAFHFSILDEYIKVFEMQSRLLCKILSNQLNSPSIDLLKFVSLYTLDVIIESAMGVTVNAQTNVDSEYVKAVKTISTVLHKRMFDLLYRFDITYRFTKLAREERNALKILHGFTEKIIVQRREEILRDKTNNTVSDKDEFGQKQKKAFLDILLESEIDGKPLSNLDIREEVDTFVFEGHDTTSSAIMFFFYNIAKYPETQKKCFEEIFEIFGKDENVQTTHEDLNKMHYTELCIKETLRLFPSVPLLGRKVTEECEINGKLIPAGANIGISPLHLGRMEEIFPNAEEFIPERFDVVTNAEKVNPFAYIPFSAGPRNCIGQKFAMLEIKSVVSHVLRNFEVEYVGTASGEPQLIAELILRTKNPLMFRLKPRIYP